MRAGPVSAAEKYQDGLTAATWAPRGPTDELALVSGEHGVLVAAPGGITLYTDDAAVPVAVPATAGRASGFIELRDALREDRPGFPDGPWAKTTLEVCLAILESSRTGVDVPIASDRTHDPGS